MAETSQSTEAQKAVIVGISGPSSSGKTTLARLLQRIFSGVRIASASSSAGSSGSDAQTSDTLNTFIIHEDDFYYPDDKYGIDHFTIRIIINRISQTSTKIQMLSLHF